MCVFMGAWKRFSLIVIVETNTTMKSINLVMNLMNLRIDSNSDGHNRHMLISVSLNERQVN